MKYVPLRDLSRVRCFPEGTAERPNMKRTTTDNNMISVSPYSAKPARAFMQLHCAGELTGTKG